MIDAHKLELENAELKLALELTEPYNSVLRHNYDRMHKALKRAHAFFSSGLTLADFDPTDPMERREAQKIKAELDAMEAAMEPEKPSSPNNLLGQPHEIPARKS
jgi:hypothetical protein